MDAEKAETILQEHLRLWQAFTETEQRRLQHCPVEQEPWQKMRWAKAQAVLTALQEYERVLPTWAYSLRLADGDSSDSEEVPVYTPTVDSAYAQVQQRLKALYPTRLWQLKPNTYQGVIQVDGKNYFITLTKYV